LGTLERPVMTCLLAGGGCKTNLNAAVARSAEAQFAVSIGLAAGSVRRRV
jgi:hypothetical protein